MQPDLFATAVLDDPYELFTDLRDNDPVHRVGNSNFYLVSSWQSVVEATQRVNDFSSHLTAALVRGDAGDISVFDLDSVGHALHVLATADDPTHATQRKLVLPTLVAKRIRALEPTIDRLASDLVLSGCRDGRIEWMAAVGDRLPMTVVARLIGLPESDVDRLVEWSYASTELLGGMVTADRLGPVVAAAVDLADYLRRRFDAARSAPRDDLLGDLARACATGVVDTDVAVLMLVQLVGAGSESSAGLLGNAVRVLASNPELQQRIRSNPDLIPALLEEVLRLESPFRGHHRHVVSDTVLGDTNLPAGAHLLLQWGAANRDSEVFDNADELHLNRPNLRGHLAFGKGLHFCVGAALARTEARLSLEALLGTTDEFRIAAGPDAAQWVPSIFVRRHLRLELETGHRPGVHR